MFRHYSFQQRAKSAHALRARAFITASKALQGGASASPLTKGGLRGVIPSATLDPDPFNLLQHTLDILVHILVRAPDKPDAERPDIELPLCIPLFGTIAEMEAAFRSYLHGRHVTYMSIETGSQANDEQVETQVEGYAGVALRVAGCLSGKSGAGTLVLNTPNRGAIAGMGERDIVEVTCHLAEGLMRPIAIGIIPDHALGLMKRVKAYERLTVEAAVTGSYATALKALALHPLVPDFTVAKHILDDYVDQHGDLFPGLS